MTTTSNKATSLRKRATLLTLMMMTTMVAATLFAAPSLSMAQQTNTGTATVTTPPPLTPEEQQQQERLQSTMAATTRNLMQGQKQVDGLVYTPRWSNVTWVEPDSLSIAFAYCLPGEFADSGQHIVGDSDLEVLESYLLAVTNDLSGWLIVVENGNQTVRLPAAAGAICSSDANDPETRILSPQEQIVINNIIKQFITIRTTQINNINQVINIINNVTRPPPTNNTGGGGGNTTEPLTVGAGWDVTTGGGDAPATLQFFADATGGRQPYSFHWDFGDSQQYDIQNTLISSWSLYHTYQNPGNYTATVTVTDSVGQTASDSIEGLVITPPTGNGTGGNNTGGIPANWQAPVITQPDDITVQAIGPEGAPVSFQVTAEETLEGDTYTIPGPASSLECDHESGETFPIGETIVTCTAIGQEWEPGLRHTTQESFTITVEEEFPAADGVIEPPTDTVEEPPVADGEAEPPTNDTGGQ
jgi:PKD repeat protein